MLDADVPVSRIRFASRYGFRHLGLSLVVALACAGIVFGLLYPPPYRAMLGVGSIFMLVIVVDVVCGPLLTLVLASPRKSRRERWLDFSLVGLIQLAALGYGLHSVWAARPVALVFEVDRLVVVTANQLQADALPSAPEGLRRVPWIGQLKASTRPPRNSDEVVRGMEQGSAGISLAQQPDWWRPWSEGLEGMRRYAKPLSELMERRPEAKQYLQDAAQDTGRTVQELRYLPLVSNKTLDWVALLDQDLNVVGWAPVDGF